ncbi:hypothetical protein JF535_04930 [Microbulbifer salipaludis]|uniref:Uncharacterized protein n=1 Tax=Microbulbifer salipaludis TaxID=187980 RepID=A0ABS3E4H4_9GAMM|nr:hypothetical protein [Microbulbifer salipaludis]MBN8430195.1 hypothetical protein [Microbulbifer salipaludis]
MKLKKILLAVTTLTGATFSLFSQAHEGHAPAGVIHEMHHMLWLAMALSVSALAVFLIRKAVKSRSEKP